MLNRGQLVSLISNGTGVEVLETEGNSVSLTVPTGTITLPVVQVPLA